MPERRIRIGNQTAPSAARPVEPFEYAVENGFDAFEWFLDSYGKGDGWGESDLAPEARKRLGRTAAEHDIALSVHAPWWLDPFEAEGREDLFKSLGFALDTGAANLNMHLSLDRGIEAFVKTLRPFLRSLVDLPVRLSIENTPFTGPGDFNELFKQLERARIPIEGRLGMCLDLGHANLFPLTRNDYLSFVDGLAKHVPIIHVHLHENYGDDDTHLPLFTGPSGNDPSAIEGFVERMKRRGFAGSIILEQWPDPPSLLNLARDRLIRLFHPEAGRRSSEVGVL